MTSQTKVWAEAAALFDELAPQPPNERHRMLAGREVSPAVRQWLDDLLRAHDTDDSLLIDRQVEALAGNLNATVQALAPEQFIGQRFGPWQACALAGQGGMSLVLKGERADGQFTKRVAIKILHPELMERAAQAVIEQEVRTLANLEHPGIVQMLDGGVRHDGVGWLAMEFVDGQPLDAWSDANAPTHRDRVALLIQAAEAVSYCHRSLIAHGDIKPGNLLVAEEGRVRLMDFGIADRLAGTVQRNAPEALPRWCSPGYASPERLRGARPSIADDVYALGALLFRLLHRQGMRSAPQQTRLIQQSDGLAGRTATGRQPACDDRDLDAIMARATVEQAGQRYPSVEAMLDDLRRWLGGLPVAARNGGQLYRLRRWLERHRALSAAAVLTTVAVLGGSGLALWQADRAQLAAEQATQAQARAELTSQFLLDLFEAQIPDLPQDEMPSTRQLLEQGIERARDPDTGPPEMRADLLTTLAGILLSRRQLDQADTLIEEAASLAGDQPPPALAVRLAVLEVERTRLRNELVALESALERAIELLGEHQPASPQRLEMRRDLGRLLMRREDFDQADTVLKSVLAEARQHPDTHDLQQRLAGDLAVVAGRSGQPEQAIERFQEVLALKRAQAQISPLSLATTQVNIAGLQAQLGRYQAADEGYRQVLAWLEPFADLPQGTRATSLAGLADLQRWRGRFADAEVLIRQSAEEWRRLLNLDSVDEDFFIHYYLAELHDDAERYDQATARINLAIERMQGGQEAPPGRVAQARADLARFQCRMGDIAGASSSLAITREVLNGARSMALAQAEATCALEGLGTVADTVLPESMLEQRRASPGELNALARFELLLAEQMLRLNKPDTAAELIEQVAVRLQQADVVDSHPLLAQVQRLRSMQAKEASAHP